MKYRTNWITSSNAMFAHAPTMFRQFRKQTLFLLSRMAVFRRNVWILHKIMSCLSEFYYKHGRTWLMMDVLLKRRKIRVSMSTDYRIQRKKILRNFSRLLFTLESRVIIRLPTSFLCHPPASAFKFPLICSARLCNVIGLCENIF